MKTTCCLSSQIIWLFFGRHLITGGEVTAVFPPLSGQRQFIHRPSGDVQLGGVAAVPAPLHRLLGGGSGLATAGNVLAGSVAGRLGSLRYRNQRSSEIVERKGNGFSNEFHKRNRFLQESDTMARDLEKTGRGPPHRPTKVCYFRFSINQWRRYFPLLSTTS
jgi:hypothetical protein